MEGICNQMNADEMFDLFYSTLDSIYNDSFPCITRKTKPMYTLKAYINAELRELFKQKHGLEKKSNIIPLYTETYIGIIVNE